jgi:hypothetical protein
MAWFNFFKTKSKKPKATQDKPLATAPKIDQPWEAGKLPVSLRDFKPKPPPEKIRTVQATRIAPEGPQTGFGSVHIPIEAAPEVAADQAPAVSETAPAAEKIRLRFQAILQTIPPQLDRPALKRLGDSAYETRVPLDLVLPQLADGRVVLTVGLLLSEAPAAVREAFGDIDPNAEIPVPLQEVLANLPANTLQMREDQELESVREPIATPLTVLAQLDAERSLHHPLAEEPRQTSIEASPAGEVEVSALEETAPAVAATETLSALPEANRQRLQTLLMTDEELDIDKVVQKVSELPGIRAALLTDRKGSRIAGTWSGKESAFAALLPGLIKSVEEEAAGAELGALERLTLHFDQQHLTIVGKAPIFLTVFHGQRPFKPGVTERLTAVVHEISAGYRGSEQ